MSNKNVDYREIAFLAKCSVTTVSRYFNNGYISQKLRDRIDEVLKNHNYQPNFFAKTMRKPDDAIYVITPSIKNAIYQKVIEGIQDNLDPKYLFFIVPSPCTTNDYKKTMNYILGRKPAGVILFISRIDDEFSTVLEGTNIPIYIYGAMIDAHTCFNSNDQNAIYQITKNMINDGAKSLAYVGKDLNNSIICNERQAGFNAACIDSKIDCQKLTYECNTQKCALEAMQNLYDTGISNFICGTHTAYRAGIIFKQNHDVQLTDIGYHSLADINKKFRYKAFIDYYDIGSNIAKSINFSETANKITKAKIWK